MECTYCKNTNVVKGYLMGGYRICFIPDSKKFKLFKEPHDVEVYACKDCGMISNFKLKYPKKLI